MLFFVIKQPPDTFHRSFKTDPRAFRFLRVPRHKCSTGCLIKNPTRNTETFFFLNPILSGCIPPCFSPLPLFLTSCELRRAPVCDECKWFPSLYLFSQIKANTTSSSVCTPSVCLTGCFYPPAPQSVLARRSTGSLPGLRQPYERLEI